MTTIDPNAPVAPTPPTGSALDALVGSDKKFASVEDLAKGKLQSDQFIEQLKNELRDVRNIVATQDRQLATLNSKFSILDRLEGNPNPNSNQPVAPNPTPEPPVVQGLTEADVLKLVERRDANAVAAQNKRDVDATLTKTLGDKAASFVLQRAAELGMEPKALHDLALKSPKAFYSVLGIEPNAPQSASVYQGSGRGQPVGVAPEVRNNSWYQAKKNEMGIKAYVKDTKLQQQLHRDLENLGDAFFA